MDELLKKYFQGKCTVNEQLTVLAYLKRLDDGQLHHILDGYWQQVENTSETSVATDAWKKLQLQEESVSKPTVRRMIGRSLWQVLIPATLVLLIVAGWIYSPSWLNWLQWWTAKEVVVQQGKLGKVNLPDGTHVWLNAGSSLRYPRCFLGNTREVMLQGEAFFEVKHQPQMPFIVNTPLLKIHVLGTSFDVRSYPNARLMDVAVKKGHVKVERAMAGDSSQVLSLLSAGERLRYACQTGRWHVSLIDPAYLLAWQQGALNFDNQSLDDIALALENYYGQPIRFADPALKDYTFTGGFKNLSVYAVLDVLKTINAFDYRKVSDTIFLESARQPMKDQHD